MSLINTTVP